MRKLLVVVAAGAVLAMVLGAQTVIACCGGQYQGQGQAMRGQGNGDGPFANLNLTPAQKAQIKSILTTARANAKAATGAAAKNAIEKAAFEQIKTTVLTAAQQAQLGQTKGAGKRV